MLSISCTNVKNKIPKKSSAVCTVSQSIKHWIPAKINKTYISTRSLPFSCWKWTKMKLLKKTQNEYDRVRLIKILNKSICQGSFWADNYVLLFLVFFLIAKRQWLILFCMSLSTINKYKFHVSWGTKLATICNGEAKH